MPRELTLDIEQFQIDPESKIVPTLQLHYWKIRQLEAAGFLMQFNGIDINCVRWGAPTKVIRHLPLQKKITYIQELHHETTARHDELSSDKELAERLHYWG